MSVSVVTTAAPNHMAATKQTAIRNEPLRLRNDSGRAATYTDTTVAQPTIIATVPNRGRMKDIASTAATAKQGCATIFFSEFEVCIYFRFTTVGE